MEILFRQRFNNHCDMHSHKNVEIDTDLVHQLMNHPAMEQLFHDVLSSVLLDFTETIKAWTQTATSMTSAMGPNCASSGFGRLKRLSEKVVQSSPLGQITQLIEQRAQQKIAIFWISPLPVSSSVLRLRLKARTSGATVLC